MIWSRTGGRPDGPLLVLLPGLGATAEVYAGLEAVLARSLAGSLAGSRRGGWVTVDLPGHGRSAWDPPYTFGRHADAVAELLPEDREIVVLGHSMGGVVALELAARRPVRGVVGFGIKVDWPEEHVAGAARQATRPVTFYGTRAEAVDRYLRLAGLTGLVSADDPGVDAGVVETVDGWRVAQDPATFGVGVPDMPALLAAVACPVVLARGEHDQLVTDADLRALVADPVTLPALGHNCHVESPSAVLDLVLPFA
ncbi:MAG TPA: alpha/beta hydrolase [Nocardioides sp.]|jgi:pimeloyl-ACP methyl ester carboxylesterase